MTRKERWILSEWIVAKDRVRRFHENLVWHRFDSPFAEIDLVFQARDHLVLIEVKSLDRARFKDLWHAPIVSRKQLDRLFKAREYLSSKRATPVRLLVAVVSHPGLEVEYFDPCG